jgi:5'(3')-deoxyribonucleotidase
MIGWRIEMMKVILLDVDDIIFDLVPIWIRKYNKDYSDNLKVSQISDWNIKRFVLKDCGKKIYDYIKTPDIYDSIKPVKDSLWGVDTLKTLGCRVVFVTVNNYGNAKYDLLLKYGYMDSGRDFVVAEDKALVKSGVLLDDNFQNVKDFGENGWLMSRPWNLKYKYSNRVKNWKDFVKKISPLMKE